MVSAMMKATAPITGGMICPPIEDVASTAAGKCGAVAEALHQWNGELPGGDDIGDARAVDGAHQPEEITATFAGPPRV